MRTSVGKALEHRSALTPTTAKALIDAGYIVNVERSPERIFDDSEFEKVGATLVPENTWREAPSDHIIIGLKELPVEECKFNNSESDSIAGSDLLQSPSSMFMFNSHIATSSKPAGRRSSLDSLAVAGLSLTSNSSPRKAAVSQLSDTTLDSPVLRLHLRHGHGNSLTLLPSLSLVCQATQTKMR